MSHLKEQRLRVGDISSVWQLIKYIVLRPLQFLHEMVCDNRTGLVSSTKVGFAVALVVSTVMLARLTESFIALATPCESGTLDAQRVALAVAMATSIRDIFFLFIATFAATSMGSKWIMTHYGGKNDSLASPEQMTERRKEPKAPEVGEEPPPQDVP